MTSRSLLHWDTYHLGFLLEALPQQLSVAGHEQQRLIYLKQQVDPSQQHQL